MTSFTYTNSCGWKFSEAERRFASKKNKSNFILSVVVALVIVLFVSRVLSLIDDRIQSNNVTGLTMLTEMLSIPSAEAATIKPGLFLQTDGDTGFWYINPATSNRAYISDDSDFSKLISIVAKNLTAKEFKLYANKGTASLRGKLFVYKGSTYYVGANSLKTYPLGPTGGSFAFIKAISFDASLSQIMKYKIAKGFEKVSIASGSSAANNSITKSGPTSSTGFSNGIDIDAFCKQNNYNVASIKPALDAECKKRGAEYQKKVAYYDAINNPSKPKPPVTTVQVTPTTPVTTPTTIPSPTAPTPVTTIPSVTPAPVIAATSGNGPIIRVGVFANAAEQRVRASSAFTLKDSTGNALLTVQPNQILSVDYLEGQGLYAYGISGVTNQTPSYLRMIAPDESTVFEVVSFENRPSWNLSYNDNKYLGNIELRYNTSKNRTWIISELPMETYLKGMAETSNSSPMEYLKTMAVAARTYGMYHLNRETKHGDEYFTVDATYDQVYRGYGTQMRMSNLVAAVDATKGVIVTYAGDLAITPYFSWSDGHTRSMAEVWGTDKPWLQSVVEPAGYTKTTLYGHGVGLSAYGAILLASDKYNYTYDRILKYYYRGVDVIGNYNGLYVSGTVALR